MICLIIPPSPFLLDERVFMSLGVLKVAAALERDGRKVELLDLSGVRNYEEAVRDYIARSSVEFFGITATSPQLPAAVKIAETIRKAEQLVPRWKYRIILGGPHVTLVHAAKKREAKLSRPGRAYRALDRLWEYFDVLVAGDGEQAIFEAISCIAPCLIDADDRHSQYWQSSAKLESSAIPARHLVDVSSYRYQVDGVPALSLIAQLGCPFGCGFCAGRHSPMLRHIRTRSADSIVAEMAEMRDRFGCRGFMFYDDELNINPGLEELMDKITLERVRRAERWNLRGFVKAELFTDAQAYAMHRAGFRWILVGFESGSDRILDNINKKATKADNTRCIEIARRHGLKVKALMSLGHPGESPSTIEDTERWLIKMRPDDFDATVITPYPGSPYYDEAEQFGDTSPFYIYKCRNGDRLYQCEVDYTQEADYYKGAPDGGYVSHVWTDELSAAALVDHRNDLEMNVRQALDLPWNVAAPALQYEHSMGQTALPAHILRTSGMDRHV
jgi:radical SAM superfamily enzyme YgiQ (UPF0313 family)